MMDMNNQLSMFASSPEYDAFVEKFKPKKTTDDCYTPPAIYETVREWACQEYGIEPESIVRPFYPGGDYENFSYPDGCVVLDNPPFSILSKICEFYLNRGIPFFLFAPALTSLAGRKVVMRMNHILCDARITYENGAVVQTGFVTSFGGDIIIQTAPELHRRMAETSKRLAAENGKHVPKYEYPPHIVTAAMMQKYARYGVDLKIHRHDCTFVPKLDSQVLQNKAIFGGGLLLSERAAAERAAAERADTVVWSLSDREKAIVKTLGGST